MVLSFLCLKKHWCSFSVPTNGTLDYWCSIWSQCVLFCAQNFLQNRREAHKRNELYWLYNNVSKGEHYIEQVSSNIFFIQYIDVTFKWSCIQIRWVFRLNLKFKWHVFRQTNMEFFVCVIWAECFFRGFEPKKNCSAATSIHLPMNGNWKCNI